jgi:uncharacterized protein Yka (UPF0111/DUF47 family)
MFSLQTIFGKGNQFYGLLEDAAKAAADSTKALHQMLLARDQAPALDAFRLARERERSLADKINEELVNSFVTALEREDIEALSSALVRIPKQVEKFAERYAMATRLLVDMDFAPRAAMLEQAALVVADMVAQLRRMKLDDMRVLNDRLRSIESEADRLMLELYRELYAGRYEGHQMFLIKEFFEILEKAIDRCREAGAVVYQIALKNS